ncbi:hypothetical protein IV203_011903 [Nitzschia inconspicua]|uniref:Uncharacterized protein n=1 Tax=Nitzschia inconspicua TaxID=303405 RepID=A0A9K3KTK9_9STRA|nr:hypothetical protein IV203_011903 [Nitzschia inconspicua]
MGGFSETDRTDHIVSVRRQQQLQQQQRQRHSRNAGQDIKQIQDVWNIYSFGEDLDIILMHATQRDSRMFRRMDVPMANKQQIEVTERKLIQITPSFSQRRTYSSLNIFFLIVILIGIPKNTFGLTTTQGSFNNTPVMKRMHSIISGTKYLTSKLPSYQHHISCTSQRCRYTALYATTDEDGDNNSFLREVELGEMDSEVLEKIEQEQPSEWMVMQQLLGINAFSYVLAGLIVFFLSMNILLGPGWLGNTIGIQGTGSFEEVSPSLPGTIDLNRPEFKL